MKFASDFEVLRQVRSDGLGMCTKQPRAQPVRVCVLLNEAEFKNSGYALHHLKTVFIDERVHDWDWRNGVFYYYSHVLGKTDKADILVVYEEEECAVIKPVHLVA